MRLEAMARRFDWDESAREYVQVYEHAMARRRSA
jgi:glycogen synthase